MHTIVVMLEIIFLKALDYYMFRTLLVQKSILFSYETITKKKQFTSAYVEELTGSVVKFKNNGGSSIYNFYIPLLLPPQLQTFLLQFQLLCVYRVFYSVVSNLDLYHSSSKYLRISLNLSQARFFLFSSLLVKSVGCLGVGRVGRGSLLSRDYASVICYFGKVFNVYMWVMGRVNTVCGRGG